MNTFSGDFQKWRKLDVENSRMMCWQNLEPAHQEKMGKGEMTKILKTKTSDTIGQGTPADFDGAC